MLEYVEEHKCLEHRAQLNDARSDFTAIYESDKDRIYVIGGNDAKNFYKACEYYDVSTDKWIRMAELNVARDSAACCIFNSKYIYVFSGRIKFSPKEITDVCEVFDIDKNIWEVINVKNKQNWIPCDLAMCF
jgi:N-acetylneuraminic acid mutarotase